MSLILDALRKSEAERRRGQAPSLYAQAAPLTTRPRPPWHVLLAVAGGALLLLAAGLYWFGDDQPVTKEELVEEAEQPSLVPPLATGGAPPTAPPPPTAAPAPIPAAPATVAAAPSVDALVQPPAAAPVGAPPPTPVIAATPAPATPPAEPATAAATAAEESLPPVAVLEPSLRSNLPPMKLSMHVYNIDPARRFAILDGQRVTEGSQIGAAIVLEIRRDGVVLDIAGKRVLLPRP
jgi:general secretion pathway protein B